MDVRKYSFINLVQSWQNVWSSPKRSSLLGWKWLSISIPTPCTTCGERSSANKEFQPSMNWSRNTPWSRAIWVLEGQRSWPLKAHRRKTKTVSSSSSVSRPMNPFHWVATPMPCWSLGIMLWWQRINLHLFCQISAILYQSKSYF